MYRNFNINIPFYTIISLSLEKNKRSLKKICSFPFLDLCFVYASLLGILGMCLSLLDIVRVVKNGPVLPSSSWRTRLDTGKIVTPECERDLKLMSLVLCFQYYTFLVIGVFTEKPALLIPWLVLYMFIIFGEFVIFMCNLFAEGFNISKQGILSSMFLIYNWLSIFCLFFHLVRG